MSSFHINKITLTGFKNYSFSSFEFKESVTGICGLNGVGKTNLLDALHYCCFTKSYFSRSDAMNVQFGAEGFRLESQLQVQEQPHRIVCINRGNGKKELLLDDVPYEKFSQHIGKFPCVMIAPDDVELIAGGSEERRTFTDTVISQVDSDYLQQLIIYGKVLQQRNSLLKRFAEQGNTDWSLLEILDQQLILPGNSIHKKRQLFLQELLPLVQQFYLQIAGTDEQLSLQYESQLNQQPFELLLHNSRQKDLILQRSNAGLHKDDIDFLLDGRPFKNIASQGQRKSLLFALKLAEFDLLKTHKGFAPLLLLDDVFEKLDEQRMSNLLQWVCTENSGQVFITDTHRERLEGAFDRLGVNFEIVVL